MIPFLYDSTETTFGGACICRLAESTYCVVTEERNGIYECEFQYPISGKYFDEIQIGRFIGCTHDDQGDVQPFRIYKSSAPIDGIVTFYAHHLSYKLSRVILNPFTASSVTQAISKLSTESINTNPFTFWTNKSSTGNLESKVPTSVRSILGGTEGSILDTYGGGEYKFDKWEVKLYSNELPTSRGSDTGVTIRYGKNLKDITDDVDAENVYNAIIPFWKGHSETVKEYSESATYAVGNLVRYNGTVYKCTTEISTAEEWNTGHWTTAEATDYTYTFGGEDMEVVVLLSEKIVAQSGVTNPQAVPVDFSSDFQTQPTQAQLRKRAQAYLASNDPWAPKENIKIDFVQLWQTDEYKDVAALQRVNLCDVVNVFHPELGVTANGIKVIKTVYNVLLDRYDKMELGTTRTNFIENIEENYDKQITQVAKGFEAILKAEINYATELLTNPGDSHVVFVGIDEDGNRVYGKGAINNPQEILVMNTTNPATATQVLRINKNGIGFANNVNGPYRSAWTLDGHFVADYITAGTINGNLIRTGMLSDYSSTTFVLTSDTSIVAGKQYYIRKLVPNYSSDSLYSIGDLARYNGTVYKCTTAINETESWTSSHWVTATSSDYTYILVDTPMPVELGSYYEIQNTSKNYWNLETGEFRLSATTHVGNSTIASQSDLEGFVVSTDVEYGNSDSTSTPPTTWTTNAAWEKGKYLWTRVKMTLEDGSVQYSEARRIANDKGLGVSGVEEQYYLSTSNTTQTGGTWSSTQPTWVKGRYYWTRSKVTWSDGSVTYTDPALAQALTSGNQSTDDLDDSFTQQKIFNRLTNNGEVQGIYLENGKLYINATYIKSGYMESSRIRITDLIQVMFDSETCGTLGAGQFYKTKSQSPSMYLCQGVGLSADSTIDDDIGHGVIAIDFDYGSPLIYGPHIDIRTDGTLYLAADRVSINGRGSFSGIVNIGDAELSFEKGICVYGSSGSGSGGGGGGSSYDDTAVWSAIHELQSESRTAVFG